MPEYELELTWVLSGGYREHAAQIFDDLRKEFAEKFPVSEFNSTDSKIGDFNREMEGPADWGQMFEATITGFGGTVEELEKQITDWLEYQVSQRGILSDYEIRGISDLSDED